MKKTILLFICLAGIKNTYAQATDIELWTGGALNLKVHERFSTDIEQVVKFNDTITHFKSAFSELGAKFKLNRWLSLGANYRYIENPPRKNAQRFSADVFFNLGKKGFPLSFHYRVRIQHEVRISNKNTEDYLRNKFSLHYNFSKPVDPYISFEPFFRLNGKNEIRVTRYAVGLNWRIIENLHLVSFYMFQKDVNIKRPDKSHIIGLMLSYDLRTYEKKPKPSPSFNN